MPTTPAGASASASASATRPSWALHAVLHLLGGGSLIAASLALAALPEIAIHWFRLKTPLLSLGLILILSAAFYRRRPFARFTAGLSLVVLSSMLTIALLEICFRSFNFDFRRQAMLLERTPPFFRQPRTPTGEAFFRRKGPLTWEGQVIRSQLRVLGLPDDAYRDEPIITVEYDSDGFRNPPDMSTWRTAIAGDSFTELGHLPTKALFTSLIAESLGAPVRNLGVSKTGPLTQLSYLRDFGLCPSLQQVVIVFFEGNDMEDLRQEHSELMKFRETGRRPLRTIKAQTSFLRALSELAFGTHSRVLEPLLPYHALRISDAHQTPVTLGLPPKGSQTLSQEHHRALSFFASEYATFAQRQGLRAWLAYLPCKQRVWHDQLRFHESTHDEIASWQPTDLPEIVAAECRAQGIMFLDLTPSIQQEQAGTDQLLFNALYDTHLNARGSQVVAQALAQALVSPKLLSVVSRR